VRHLTVPVAGLAPVAQVDGYLTATVGTVYTPDPGPLPASAVFVYRVRGPSGTPNRQVIASQWTTGQQGWTLWRDSPPGGLARHQWSTSPDGTALNPTRAPASPVPTGADEWLAFVVRQNDGASQQVVQVLYSADGLTWTAGTADPSPTVVYFDSSHAVRIGAQYTTVDLFNGRIYSVELRTGVDPRAGSVVWRFDANDYPGGGVLTYVDPRGRPWTLTSAAAITPKVAATTKVAPARIVTARAPGFAAVPQIDAYLSPALGNATSPDPGSPPSASHWITKVRLPETFGTTAAGSIVYGGPIQGWAFSTALWSRMTVNGSLRGAGMTWAEVAAAGVVGGAELLLATSANAPASGPLTYEQWVSHDKGATWVKIRPTETVAIGAITTLGAGAITVSSGYATWGTGRVYSVEARTGLEIGGGTVLWRFDANEYPGSGTSYVDPRGRTWTLSNGASITPKVPATSTTRPVVTLTAPVSARYEPGVDAYLTGTVGQVTTPVSAALNLPGVVGSVADTPHHNAFNMTADMEATLTVASGFDWASGTWRGLACRWPLTGAGAWTWCLQSSQLHLYFTTYDANANIRHADTLGGPGVPAGTRRVRWRRIMSTGVVTFWSSATVSGDDWVAVPSTSPAQDAGRFVWAGATVGVAVGDERVEGQSPLTGRVLRFEFLNLATGVKALDVDFSAQTPGATTFSDTAPTPKVWTVKGSASIQSSDVLPSQWCWVYRSVTPTNAGSPGVALQWVGPSQYSWFFSRRADGSIQVLTNPTGTGTTVESLRYGASAPVAGVVYEEALTFDASATPTVYRYYQRSLTTGAWIEYGAGPVTNPSHGRPYGAATPIRVGGEAGYGPNQPIYWAEARSGLNPDAGTLLWRFDANEYPGGGATSYTDPRGRTWTLTAPGAITPKVPARLVREPSRTVTVPLPVTAVPAADGYLSGRVGVVTTPDPGLPPPQWTIVAHVAKGSVPTTGTVLAVQGYDWDARASWRVGTWADAYDVRMSTNGSTWAGAAYLSPTTEFGPWFAWSVDQNVAATGYRSDNGTTWTPTSAPQPMAVAAMFDSPDPVTIGDFYQGGGWGFRDRIYSIEMRTGLDPNGGTVLWRFDANEYPARTNLLSAETSDMETGPGQWILSGGSATLSTAASPVVSGSRSLAVTKTSAAADQHLITSPVLAGGYIPVTPGQAYSGRVSAYRTGSGWVNLYVYFYDEGNGYIGNSGVHQGQSTGSWVHLTVAGAVAPAGARRAILYVVLVGMALGEVAYLDAAGIFAGNISSWTDPRGRTWTLSTAAALTPKVPAGGVPTTPSPVTATASSPNPLWMTNAASNVLDGDGATHWQPVTTSSADVVEIQVTFSESARLDWVEARFYDTLYRFIDYTVETWDGTAWTVRATVTGNAAAVVSHAFTGLWARAVRFRSTSWTSQTPAQYGPAVREIVYRAYAERFVTSPATTRSPRRRALARLS
jgi:F5/8 type C domain